MPNLDRILALVVAVTIIGAWIAGYYRQDKDHTQAMKKALPDAMRLESIKEGIYAGYDRDGLDAPACGHVASAVSHGYGGPMLVFVGIDPEGCLTGLSIGSHNETEAFYQSVVGRTIPALLNRKHCGDPFMVGQDVDAVTGATKTLNALTQACSEASRRIGIDVLGLKLEQKERRGVGFNLSDALFAFFYILLFSAILIKKKTSPRFRWLCLLSGLLAIGFVFNAPLTMVHVNAFLMGYWPDVLANLFWYALIFGLLLSLIFSNKNPYCNCLCPFGAAQEIVSAAGRVKGGLKWKGLRHLKWMQRLAAWSIIVLALYYRKAGIMSYEPFGALFAFVGSQLHFILLAVTVIASLFILRPWCRFLCPLRAVADFMRGLGSLLTRTR